MTQAQSPDQLRHLLLDMISTSRVVDADRTGKLNEADWQDIGRMARQHRLGPLLHHNCQTRGAAWHIPPSVRAGWSAAYRKSALRAMRLRQALLQLDTLLNQAEVPYAALKGAWLVQQVYAQPALRPMRDIDILVDAKHALTVFELLQSQGFVGHPHWPKPDLHSLQDKKHLPPLFNPQSGILVEVHTRLIEHSSDGTGNEAGNGAGNETLTNTGGVLGRSVRSRGVNFLPPTDTLLHLIVHAVYDHRFNNGPLSLNDIALLAATGDIEWDRFWKMAESGNWLRGCALIFAMVQYYHSVSNAGLAVPQAAISSSQIEEASLLTLQDFDQRVIVAFRSKFESAQSLPRRLALIWKRAIPTRYALMAFSGSTNQSMWIFAYYPKWLLARVWEKLFSPQSAEIRSDIARFSNVDKWLLDV